MVPTDFSNGLSQEIFFNLLKKETHKVSWISLSTMTEEARGEVRNKIDQVYTSSLTPPPTAGETTKINSGTGFGEISTLGRNRLA